MKLAADAGHRDVLRWIASEIKPRSHLEVGVREGHSLAAVLRGCDPEHLTLCDTWGTRHGGTGRGGHEHIEHLLDVMSFDRFVEWFDCQSAEMWSVFGNEIGCRQYDLVHIDGDHSYEVASMDTRRGWRYAGRALVVHDAVKSEPVRRAARELGFEPTYLFTGDSGTGVWLK